MRLTLRRIALRREARGEIRYAARRRKSHHRCPVCQIQTRCFTRTQSKMRRGSIKPADRDSAVYPAGVLTTQLRPPINMVPINGKTYEGVSFERYVQPYALKKRPSYNE